ncbi:hypothetical protein PGT21_003000 [Puccinia graminis f. sp. tritici]|uniref:Uncharacterized protein n=1 Tax=Puccinia graminis f. sp. tritici TaxID=56615 RepID=A0A5B0PIF6_PUCGR|nr:hypothetical protein PGT21_003000 [Puccinia graminis f. sp. tritici]
MTSQLMSKLDRRVYRIRGRVYSLAWMGSTAVPLRDFGEAGSAVKSSTASGDLSQPLFKIQTLDFAPVTKLQIMRFVVRGPSPIRPSSANKSSI